jgi:tol-pal system protein YbgF
MVQEQVSRLQLAVNNLAESLKVINKRIDDQSASDQKQVADLRLLVNNLQGTLSTVREKLDDNTVRVSQLGQELPAIRDGLKMIATQLSTLVGLLQPPVNPIDPNAPPGSASGPLGSLTLPDSPTAIFDAAMNDYTAGRLPLAIEGFTQYVTQYGDSPKAAEAQFWIGMAYFTDKKPKEALEAFDKVVKNYKGSEFVPQALFQQALTHIQLKQQATANRIFNQIIKEFPETNSAIMARQRLGATAR